MSQLHPCPNCSRHVRLGDARCPFCEAEQGTVAPRRVTAPSARLGRAAILMFGAAATSASFAAAACTTGTIPGPTPVDASADGPPDSGLPDTSNIAKPYGAPPADGFQEMV